MEKYKKFIEKVYNGEICFSVVDFKEIIEGAFPGEFYSPKIGDWVWIKSDQSWNNLEILVYFNGFDSESDTYGFATMKNWVNNFRISSFHTGIKITKATDKEVTDALTAEAKKRGFKEGVTIIPVGFKNPQKINTLFVYIGGFEQFLNHSSFGEFALILLISTESNGLVIFCGFL